MAKILIKLKNTPMIGQTEHEDLSRKPLRCRHHPGGMPENSPTFQRWVIQVRNLLSPEGTAELRRPASRPFGTNSISAAFRSPTLKRWAMIACPSGTRGDDKNMGRAELERWSVGHLERVT